MTWSIIARDRETGQFGIAVATRFFAGGALVPHVRSRVGAIASQALVNRFYGPEGMRLLEQGRTAADAVSALTRADAGCDHRQLRVIDAQGRTAAHTGKACIGWCGHVGAENFSAAGNILAGGSVLEDTAAAYERSAALPFPRRLIAAMRAGEAAGGDRRGKQSAALVIWGEEDWADLDLRVDDHPDPLSELERLEAASHELFVPFTRILPSRRDRVGLTDREAIDQAIARPCCRADFGLRCTRAAAAGEQAGLPPLPPCAMIAPFERTKGECLAMTILEADKKLHHFDVEDIEYLRHGEQPLLARVFRPRGAGPFPALVECHGGAWCLSDRTTERLRHEAMAKHGIVSVALDFRSGNTDPYPASVQDINYAVRWAKLNAGTLKTRPELVGLSGQSSGGHLAMLVAMRPHDRRYAAIPLAAGANAQDASVRCVVMSWPVINPLGRYRFAKRTLAGATAPEWPKSIIPRHDAYWRTEEAMTEGNPMLALERGEKVQTPPAVWFQGRGDLLHDYKDEDSSFPGNEPQRFVANYRKAGGEIVLHYLDAERHAGHSPDLSRTGDMFERMVGFVHRHIPVD